MGTTGGGVWKTLDGGLNWKNISDNYFKTLRDKLFWGYDARNRQ